jgi:hypothetical protein
VPIGGRLKRIGTHKNASFIVFGDVLDWNAH